MAAQDLTTLMNAKLWLPITSANTNDDATLSRLITAVSQDFMRATKRPDLLLATYAGEVHQGDGGARLVLFHWPIVAVTALTVGTATITASSDKVAPGYYFDAAADLDPERNFQLYLNGFTFTDGAAIKIDYKAGYVQPGATPESGQIALPQDVEQAVIDWMAYRYKGRPNVGVTMRRAQGGEEAQIEQVDAPPNVLQVIERYKRPVPSIDRRGDEAAARAARTMQRKK